MAEPQIAHLKSSLVLSTRFPVVKRRSRSVAKAAYYNIRETSLEDVFTDQVWLKERIKQTKIIVINQNCHMLPHSRTGLAPAPLAVLPAHISLSPPPQSRRLEQATRVMSS